MVETHQWNGYVAETRAWLGRHFVSANEDGSLTIERHTGRERVQLGEWLLDGYIDVYVWQPHTFTRRVGRDGGYAL